MENGEIKFETKDLTDESGYSEKKLDQNTELHAGQWIDLQHDSKQTPRKSKPIAKIGTKKQSQTKKGTTVSATTPRGQHVSEIQQKIHTGLEEVSDIIVKEIQGYVLIVQDNEKVADEVLKRIIELQTTQKSLLQALKWEAKGSLEITKLPKQVQNLLK